MTTINIVFSMELHGSEEYLVGHPLILPVWLTIEEQSAPVLRKLKVHSSLNPQTLFYFLTKPHCITMQRATLFCSGRLVLMRGLVPTLIEFKQLRVLFSDAKLFL